MSSLQLDSDVGYFFCAGVKLGEHTHTDTMV